MQVVGRRLRPHEDDLLPCLGARLGVVGGEVDLADRRAGRRVEALGEHRRSRPSGRTAGAAAGRAAPAARAARLRGLSMSPSSCHLDGHAQRGGRGALADPGLQDEEATLLDRELDVAHVAVVVLEQMHDVEQLRVTLGEVVAHRVERLGDADAGDDVFALRVGEEVAVGRVLAGRRVARERDAGAGVVALVAEHHRLHVHGGAEVVRDALHPPVVTCAAAVPRLEHGFDRVPELLGRVGREVDARFGLRRSPLNVSTRPARSAADSSVSTASPFSSTRSCKRLLEHVAGDVEHDLAEHLHEPAVRVVREALVARLLGEALHRVVVEPEVEDGVHHPGHRERRARTHRHEQRIDGVAEALAHLLLRAPRARRRPRP